MGLPNDSIPEVKVEEMVSVKKTEYEKLKNDSKKLRALEGAGVDNWDGYDIAMEALDEEEKTNG